MILLTVLITAVCIYEIIDLRKKKKDNKNTGINFKKEIIVLLAVALLSLVSGYYYFSSPYGKISFAGLMMNALRLKY